MSELHEWVSAREVGLDRDWTVCRNCGFILRSDRANEFDSCRGRVRVELRDSVHSAHSAQTKEPTQCA